ncbi:hypothetical protein ACP70R_041938 [Stipagrostis hirtigluma subsp. patula]
MDGEDEEMQDAYPRSPGRGGVEEGGFEEEEEEGAAEGVGEGMMVMEVAWFQVDLDYEFDAPRWFDLAQEEAPAEAAAAQQWFASAPSYPPSPLISQMFAGDLGLQSLRSITDTVDVHSSKTAHQYSSVAKQRIDHSDVPTEGQRACNGISTNERKPGSRATVKGIFSRGSTLMKPTASQLARQNRQVEVKNTIQSKMSVGVRSDRSTMSSNDCTHQAAKRQRLEKGHLNKHASEEPSCVVATNQPELIHKTHQKNVLNSNFDSPSGIPKLKITVPREPELATKLRAERSRILRAVPANSKKLNQRDAISASTVQAASTRRMRTIRHVTQPFRAIDHQHASVQRDDAGSNMQSSTSICAAPINNADKKPEDCRNDLFKFKARPLDKKIVASKGDVGVFRSTKRNATVPKEFNLSTSRKGKQAPLSELFNKLSLTTASNHGLHQRQVIDLPNYITTKTATIKKYSIHYSSLTMTGSGIYFSTCTKAKLLFWTVGFGREHISPYTFSD